MLPHSVDQSDLDSISRLTSLVHFRVVLDNTLIRHDNT